MAESAITVGSYARGSIIRIESDIDILAPLDYPTYKETYDNDSQAFLYMVRDSLNKKFGSTSVSSKKVAVKLDFSSITVDVVPCFRRDGGGFFMPDGWQLIPFFTQYL
jgi:tRNA nucleotidyltransferase (CCA-adding enzyme)